MSEQVRIDLEDPTGNFWVDNGLVVLAERYGASAELDLEQVQLDLIPKLRRVETDGSLKWTLPATSFIDGQKLKAFSKSSFLESIFPEIHQYMRHLWSKGCCCRY